MRAAALSFAVADAHPRGAPQRGHRHARCPAASARCARCAITCWRCARGSCGRARDDLPHRGAARAAGADRGRRRAHRTAARVHRAVDRRVVRRTIRAIRRCRHTWSRPAPTACRSTPSMQRVFSSNPIGTASSCRAGEPRLPRWQRQPVDGACRCAASWRRTAAWCSSTATCTSTGVLPGNDAPARDRSPSISPTTPVRRSSRRTIRSRSSCPGASCTPPGMIANLKDRHVQLESAVHGSFLP